MSADFTLAERLVAAYPLQKVSTRRGTISYREAGAGPPLCLLHGIGSQSGSWVPQLDTLAARFHVIAWDAPGYGESDQILTDPPATSDYADSLVGLLDALSIDRVLLVGNSLGALIAGAFAAMQPDMHVTDLAQKAQRIMHRPLAQPALHPPQRSRCRSPSSSLRRCQLHQLLRRSDQRRIFVRVNRRSSSLIRSSHAITSISFIAVSSPSRSRLVEAPLGLCHWHLHC